MHRIPSSLTPSPAMAVALAALLAASGGLAMAATSSSPVIRACVSKKTGALRVANKCRHGERSISWNQRGPEGPVGKGTPGATGSPGIPGASGATGPAGVSATSLWAVVDKTGALLRGSHAVSARAVAAGYEVVFDRDVSKCSYEATLGATSAEVGEVGVGPRAGNVAGVFVYTASSTGSEEAHGFNVALFC
jgi:hypothetical protein